MRTSTATCSLCDANCGVLVEHEGARVHAIRGDPDDPLSRGHVCPKVVGLKHIHDDPDRVRVPLIRTSDGSFREATWDAAVALATDRLAHLQRAHGNDSVGLYIGNPTAHSYAAALAVPVLMRALSSRNIFSANSMDSWPRQIASAITFGSPLLLPVPDIDRAELFVVLGANPAVSNGSMMTAPDVKRRLRAIRERGGRLVVIDPRRTETAALADAHHFIRPASDALFLAALASTICTNDLARPAPYVDGVAALRAALAPFTPERTAPLTGIGADVTRALAHELATKRGVIHARMGTCTQQHGLLATWLVDVVHALSGNLDREGGAMFTEPAVPLAALAQRFGLGGARGRWSSRVRALPEVNGELPIGALADEIETPGAGQLRGLVVHAGNLARSAPNSARMERALQRLEALVCVDIYVNETTQHAHVILPPTFGLERDHYPLLFSSVMVRNTARYAPALLAGTPGAQSDWQILTALAAGVFAKRTRAPVGRIARALLGGRESPRRALALLLRLGGRVSLADLERAPHGVDLGALTPRLPCALYTRDRRIDLAPVELLRALADLARSLEQQGRGDELPPHTQLVLIGRRALHSNNSWMHNTAPLVRAARCTLLMHPDDARTRGLTHGARVRIASRTGALDAELEVTDEIARGVVSLPHGWGHDAARSRLSVARAHVGVNANLLTDDSRIDALTHTIALNGVPVAVTAT